MSIEARIFMGSRKLQTCALMACGLISSFPAFPAPEIKPVDQYWQGAENSDLIYIAPASNKPIHLVLRRQDNLLSLFNDDELVAQRSMTGLSRIKIGGPDRTDTRLTIDYRTGEIPAAIYFQAGALGKNTNNELALLGGMFPDASSVTFGPHDGVITNGSFPVYYKNLTPIIDTTPSVNYTFNDFGSPGHTTNIIDGGAGQTQINDGGSASFETTTISNKQNFSYVIQSASTNVVVNNPTPATGMAQLTVVGNVGNSVFTITPTTIPVIATGFSATPATDSLTVHVPIGATYSLNVTHGASGYAGTYTFSNGYQPITFSNMLSISPAPVVAGPASIPSLSRGALLGLGVLLGAVGLAAMKSRQKMR